MVDTCSFCFIVKRTHTGQYSYEQCPFKGGKIYKNTKKPSLYSQSLFLFIHKTPVIQNHPTTREIKGLLRPRLTSTGITVYFYMSSSLINILQIQRQSFKHSIQEDIMGNNYIFVMLWNLSVISQWIFPQCLFFYFWRKI